MDRREFIAAAGTVAAAASASQAFAQMAAESRAKTAALNSEIEARRRISEREQLLIAAIESSNDAILTQTLDGVITGWNRAA